MEKMAAMVSYLNDNDEEHKKIVAPLVRYVDGESPMLGKSWKDCRFLYIPCCIINHWIALRVNVLERKIEVYDSLGGYIKRDEIIDIANILPKFICARLNESYGMENLSIDKMSCPKQLNGSDCGMFTVKYIEFLLAEKDVGLLRPDYMKEWREKLASDIFSEYFDP